MAVSLFAERTVSKTTLPKAKELRRVAEPLITRRKEIPSPNRRLAFDRTRQQESLVGSCSMTWASVMQTVPAGMVRILSAVSALVILAPWPKRRAG